MAKEEANYKLCRVKKVMRGPRGIPYAVTHDGRTLRYPDPDVKAHDTLRWGPLWNAMDILWIHGDFKRFKAR